MTNTEHERDVTELFDFREQCCWNEDTPHHDQCPKDAEWIVQTRCCRFTALLCTEHLLRLKTPTPEEDKFGWGCLHCGTTGFRDFDEWATVSEL